MKKSCLTIAILLLLVSGHVRAQVQPLFSQYMHDATVLNPAYAGSADALMLSLQGRMQWVKSEGSPTTQLLSAHAPISSTRLAAGLRLQHETIGSGRQLSIAPALAYRIRLAKGTIAGGLSAKAARYTAGYQNLLLHDKLDKVFALQESMWVVTFGAGIYYATDKFYLGFTVPELLPASRPDPEQNIFSRHLRQYMAHTGYVFKVSPDVVLKPNLLISIPEQGVAYFDANLNVLFREVIWLGASYRSSKALAGLVQLQLNSQWRIGYSWDMPLQPQQTYGSDSHELSLQYSFTFDRTAVRSPRYF